MRTRAGRYIACALILFVYPAVMAAVYVLVGRFLGWGVYKSQIAMRTVHLLPSLALTVLLGAALATVVALRSREERAVGVAMAVWVMLIHVTTYFGIWNTGTDAIYRVAAIMEALVLVMFAETAYIAFLNRRHSQPDRTGEVHAVHTGH